jgi:hypothetical protein
LRYGTPGQRAEADRLLAAITSGRNEHARRLVAWNAKANDEGEHEAEAEYDAVQQHENEHGDCTDKLLRYIRATGALPTGWPESTPRSTSEHIPSAAVEAAARAMYEDATEGMTVPSWADLPPDVHRYRLRAVAALKAAAPLLRPHSCSAGGQP